jgi:hypothetical protein
MRLFQLVRAAFEAESLHLRRVVRMRGIQLGLAAGAAVFALLLLVMLHLAAFAALLPGRGAVTAALIVAAGDLVLAAILAFAARRAGHDRIAEEARDVRRLAVRQIGESAASALALAPLLRGRGVKKGLMGAALAALVTGLISRR